MSYTITINVGLKVGRTATLNSYDHVAEVLHRLALSTSTVGHTLQCRKVDSDTEPTLVGRWTVKVGTAEQAVSIAEDVALSIAHRFGQEAVPYYVEGDGLQQGGMVGPKAAEWGPFNAAYFITIDGHALNMPSHGDLLTALDSIIITAEEIGVDMGAIDDARRLVGQ